MDSGLPIPVSYSSEMWKTQLFASTNAAVCLLPRGLFASLSRLACLAAARWQEPLALVVASGVLGGAAHALLAVCKGPAALPQN